MEAEINMFAELANNKLLLFGLAFVVAVAIYKIFNKKDRVMKEIEREYNEVVTSDKYKVKGQHSE